ncbi:MAG: M24 family metallopeptidase [Bacillota bacterium]
MMAGKLDRLREGLSQAEIDALLVMRPENRRYISGFRGSSAFIIVGRQGAWLLTDFRYIEQAREQCPEFTVIRHGVPWMASLQELLTDNGIEKLGFEKDYLTYGQYEGLSQALETQLVPVSGLVEKLRRIKDEAEVASMQRAADIAEAAFAEILPQIRPGRTERDIALDLEIAMRRRGAEGMAFPIIAASGPRSCLPHGAPTDRVLEQGDFLTLDFGARVDGYCSDMTRTVVLGEPDAKQREIYDIVLKAQLAAQAAVKPGLLGKQLDQIARDIISAAGYGENFGHGLGHGVGLMVHEGPGAGSRSEDVLEPGMVVTVEPGIYLPGWGGVRIEDMVLVTEDGHRNFNHSSKELIIL